VFSPAGMTGRRDDDRDGFFEYELDTTADGIETRRRDPQTRAITRRETRTFGDATVSVVIEEDGDVVNRYTAGAEAVAAEAQISGWFGETTGEYCGAARDAHYGDLLFKGIARTARCLEEHHRPDLAAEVISAGGRVMIQCTDEGEFDAVAPDAHLGGTITRGRVILNTTMMDEIFAMFGENGEIEALIHEVMHYTSLGMHDPAQSGDNLIPTGAYDSDRVYACAKLCATKGGGNKCQCATCLEVQTCHEDCKLQTDCTKDMGAICPCEDRHKWYPTYAECVEDCPKGLKCFGYSRCKNLDRRC
jgi:hypothetical protein